MSIIRVANNSAKLLEVSVSDAGYTQTYGLNDCENFVCKRQVEQQNTSSSSVYFGNTGQCQKIQKRTIKHSKGQKGRNGTYNCPYNKK